MKFLPPIPLRRMLVLFGTALSIFALLSATAYAAGTQKVDRMLQQAMEEPANMQPIEADPAPALPVEDVEAEAAPPVMEEEAAVAEITESEPVIEIAEPAPQPRGFVFGNMRWLPSLELGQSYNDNILAAEDDATDDFVTVIRPQVRAAMLDSRHELSLDLMYERLQYWEHNDESVNNYSAALDGRVMGASEYVSMPYGFYYEQDHESRAEDLTRDLPEEPVTTEEYGAEAGIDFRYAKFGFKLLGRFVQERFHDEETEGGVTIVRDDADRETWEGETEVSYQFRPGHSFRLGGLLAKRNYDKRNFEGGGFTGPLRDNELYAVWAGLKMDFEGAFFGDVKVGFEERNYTDADELNGLANMLADITLGWNVSDSATFKALFSHGQFEDDQIVNPILQTRAGLSYEQRLWEKVLLTLGGEYRMRDFEEIAREDETYRLEALIDYLINERFSVGGKYAYSERDSDLSGFDYDQNVWLLHLTGKL